MRLRVVGLAGLSLLHGGVNHEKRRYQGVHIEEGFDLR